MIVKHYLAKADEDNNFVEDNAYHVKRATKTEQVG